MCPGSGDPFYVVTYYIELVTTSWTYSSLLFLTNEKCGIIVKHQALLEYLLHATVQAYYLSLSHTHKP